jgi:hypothetical protein
LIDRRGLLVEVKDLGGWSLADVYAVSVAQRRDAHA